MWVFLLRELRAEARSGRQTILRCVSVGFVLAAFAAAWWNLRIPAGQGGSGLFGLLGRLSVLFYWCLGPLLTADCIASERRAGTLGLLWLTPLRPMDVVVAKALAQWVRAAVGWAATVPVFAIPLALGGVGWADIARLAVLQVATLGLSMASGLVVSVWVTGWWRVRWAALGLNGVLLGVFLAVYQAAWILPQWGAGGGPAMGLGALTEFRLRMWGWQYVRAWHQLRTGVMPFYPPTVPGVVLRSAAAAVVSVLLTGFVWVMAVRLLARGRREPAAVGRSGLGRWTRRAQAWAVGLVGLVFLLGAVADWPRVEWVREVGAAVGWLLAGMGTVHAATRLVGVRESGWVELMAVVPGGTGRWLAWERGKWGRLVLVGLVPVWLGHAVALSGLGWSTSGRYPWWMWCWLMGQAVAVGATCWGAGRVALAMASAGCRPVRAVGVGLGGVAVLEFLVEPWLRRGLSPLFNGVPGWAGEVWMSSAGAPELTGAAVVAWCLKLVLLAGAVWGVDRWGGGRPVLGGGCVAGTDGRAQPGAC